MVDSDFYCKHYTIKQFIISTRRYVEILNYMNFKYLEQKTHHYYMFIGLLNPEIGEETYIITFCSGKMISTGQN